MRRKFTPEGLQRVFQRFIDRNVNIAPIRNHQPEFGSETRFLPPGRLKLKGRFSTRPSEVQFDLSYVWEGGAWRLIALNVQVVPVK